MRRKLSEKEKHMRKCLVSGSFDPITLGHIDIIKRAGGIFDSIYAVMLINPEKEYLFTREQRIKMLELSVQGIAIADFYDGYTVDYCSNNGINYIVRGIRTTDSYAYEHKINEINKSLNPDIETIYIPSSPEYRHISSSLIREKLIKGEDVSPYVPAQIADIIGEYYGDRNTHK